MLVLETEHVENPVLDSEQNLKRRRKMPKIDIEPNGRFSTALKIAIEKKGLSLTDVAQKADSTYENMRKLVGGRTFPSRHLLRALATVLGEDRKEWEEYIEADKLFKRYKTLPKHLGVPPELEPFQAIIPRLSPQSREILLATAKTLQKQDSAHAK
jgi:transcriptional regulator with XRE-family HTH domain